MTKHPLLLTCLVAACVAACAPAGMAPPVPGPGATTPRSGAIAVPTAEGGDAAVRFGLAMPGAAAARRLLYVSGEIETLDIDLYWLDGATARQVHSLPLDQAAIADDPIVTFTKLKRGRTYRVVATAWRTVSNVRKKISVDADSRMEFTIGHPQSQTATDVPDLPVVLTDTETPVYGAGTTLAIADGATVHPSPTASFADVAVSDVALTFEGSRARVAWSTSSRGPVDYDVSIAPVGTPGSPVVDAAGADETDLIYGVTRHVRTFELGAAAFGDYVATVRVKGKAASASATAALVKGLSGVALEFVESNGPKARITWNTTSAANQDFDVQLLGAGGSAAATATYGDVRGKTSHLFVFPVSAVAYGDYTARVRLRDRAATTTDSAAAATYRNAITGVALTKPSASNLRITWNQRFKVTSTYIVKLLRADGTEQASYRLADLPNLSNTQDVPTAGLPSGTYTAQVAIEDVADSAATSTGLAYAAPSGVTISKPELTFAGQSDFLVLEFKSSSAEETTYTIKFFKAGAPFHADKTFTFTDDGTVHAYGRRIAAPGATAPFDAGASYTAEVWIDAQKVGTSASSVYVPGADPIIGRCTISPPDCVFAAPTIPERIEP